MNQMNGGAATSSAPGADGRRSGAQRIPFSPQLDTLRCIAVTLVALEHYLPYQLHKLGVDGGYGVWIFFTLSGFLITNILLDYRGGIETGQTGTGYALKIFYIRRSLRIFPVFYLVTIFLYLTGFIAWENELFWHLTYTTNIWTAINNEWGIYAGHLWSLAVEEQFYLVWPFIVLIAPARLLLPIVATSVVAAIAFRAWGVYADIGLATRVLPIGALDTLGTGALLAMLRARGNSSALDLFRRYGGFVLLLLPVLGMLSTGLKEIVAPAVIAFSAAWLIDRCVIGFRGWLGTLFSLPPLIYLGRISYGLYLYHYIVRWYIPGTFGYDFGSHTANNLVSTVTWSTATILVAALSWHLFESPINNLKRYFHIVPRQDIDTQGVGKPSRQAT